jgi:hypothetical protein
MQFFLAIFLLATSQVLAVKPERNLEDYGYSPSLESYRQRISSEFAQNVPTVSEASDIPSPLAPPLDTSYGDLVPPPTKPKSRKFYQPRLRDVVPGSRDEFEKDRRKRIRDYQRPPDFNLFLEKHKKPPTQVLGNTEWGLTGLYRTVSANTLPEKTFLFHTGVSRTKFDRVFGERVRGSIEKIVSPMGLVAGLSDQFEIALTGNMVNEKSVDFPFIHDFEKTEVEEVMLWAKYKFLDNPSKLLQSAMGFGVQNAMGKQVSRRGLDGSTFSGFLSLSREFDRWIIHSNLGITLASVRNGTGNEQPNNVFYNLGAEVPVSKNTRILVELNGLDWAGFGNNIDLSLGARYQMRREFSLQFNIPVTIIRSRFPQDYSHLLSIGATVKL